VQNPLAMHVLEGEFNDGDTVVVDREPGSHQLVFRAGAEGSLEVAAPHAETAGV
jgi:hypothetical protein